jgi:hypothetical protein
MTRPKTIVGPDLALKLPEGVTDHGEENGLRIRSIYDSYWGGRKFYLVNLAAGRQLDGGYLAEDAARVYARRVTR